MSNSWLLTILFVQIFLRLRGLRRFWRLPLQQGEGWFLGTPVAPDFYRTTGVDWLRKYRTWLVLPLVLEAVVLAVLLSRGRLLYTLYAQFIGVILTSIWFTLTVAQFAARACVLAPAPAAQAAANSVSAVQLSLTPRRLRDHSDWRVEACVIGMTLVALFLLIQARGQTEMVRPLVWLLYLQTGLLLLKQLFIRWRLKLPLNRAEDYQRWRTAWLTYHLHVFDAARVFIAVAAAGILVYERAEARWGVDWLDPLAAGLLLLGLACFTVYCVREFRRLAVVERAIKPLELVKEFPPTPVAEGRFMAGGLLYLNRDNPVILARSPQGIALNLANRSTYLWLGYLAGLVWLVLWQAAR